MPTVALTAEGVGTGALSAALSAAGVVALAGHACAPMAHQALGTAPDGALRISAGPGTPLDAAERVAEALAPLL